MFYHILFIYIYIYNMNTYNIINIILIMVKNECIQII